MAVERSNRGESGQEGPGRRKGRREVTWGVPRGGATVGEESFGQKRFKPPMPHNFDIVTRRGEVEYEIQE